MFLSSQTVEPQGNMQDLNALSPIYKALVNIIETFALFLHPPMELIQQAQYWLA
jgi:hypothetical protein